METVRWRESTDPPKWVKRQESFIKELNSTVCGDETLTSLLFMMLISFCNGSMPHYPIKKILLLIWKSVLAMMGGLDELAEVKKAARVEADLPPVFPENQISKPLILPQPNYDPR